MDNDTKVVTFKNISSIEFTPALGAMFNSRPIFGKVEAGKIMPNEELYFPYHIGRRLAINLAKLMLVREMPAPEHGKGDPSVTQKGFGEEQVNALVSQILVSEYSEEKPIKETETDILLRKFEELNKTVEDLKGSKVASDGFKDKKQVIEELTKKGITFDARKSKAELEKLLA